MAKTPEGETKKAIRELLAEYAGMYTYWPVPSGFGKRTVDVIGCFRGRFFAIEAKKVKGKPTLLQTITLDEIGMAMGKTFVVAGPQDPALGELRTWLDRLVETVGDYPHITPDQVRRRTL